MVSSWVVSDGVVLTWVVSRTGLSTWVVSRTGWGRHGLCLGRGGVVMGCV